MSSFRCCYCSEIFRRSDICPWCGSEGIEAITDEDAMENSNKFVWEHQTQIERTQWQHTQN